MSEIYVYVATKTTADPFIPPASIDIDRLSRDTSDAFYALQGGHFQVGKLAFYPTQRAVANHLLCDGKEVPKSSFPELYEYLGDFEGVPTDPLNFVLPNYIGSLVAASTAAAETVEGGTVTSETPYDPGTGAGGSYDYAVDSGGRYFDFWIPF